jgi:ferric-dicitrate binding protein FerR (iron transport regulator)
MQPKSNTILKVISNEASDEERIAIEKWANKSVENSNTLKGHKKLWNILDYECDHCPDLQKAWNKINTSLSPLPIKTRSFDLVYYAQRIAAILFLVGALAFVYF